MNYKNITFKDVISNIDSHKITYWDMESFNDTILYEGGFYGSIRLSQFMQESWNSALLADMAYVSKASIPELYYFIIENKVAGYNLAYDFGLLHEQMVREFSGDLSTPIYKKGITTYEELLTLTREVNPLQKSHKMDGRFSLDDTYEDVLGFDPYAKLGLNKKKLQKTNWQFNLSGEQYQYAATDVYYMPDLHRALLDKKEAMYANNPKALNAFETRYYIARLSVLAGIKMQDTGLSIDHEQTANYIEKYTKQKEEAKQTLDNLGMPKDINYGSSVQVSKALKLPSSSKVVLKRIQHIPYQTYIDLLLHDMEAGERKINKSRKPENIKEAEIEKLITKYNDAIKLTEQEYNKLQETVKQIMLWRSGNSRASFATKVAKVCYYNTDNRMHGHFTPTTTTGRYSSSQENLQNSPRDSKAIFKSDRGMYIGFDFAQIELRTMAVLAGEQRMREVFIKDGDIHQNTQDMCNLTIRTIAKNVNFGNLYGMGVYTFLDTLLQNDIYVPIDQLRELQRMFYAVYPAIPEYHEKGSHNSKHNIPNYSIMGQPFFSKYFNQMNNLANQASGTSEILKMAIANWNEHSLLWSDTCNIVLNVHDAVLFEYTGDMRYLDHYAYSIGLLAQKAWFQALHLGYDLGTARFNDVPMPIEVGYSQNWKGVDDPKVTIQGSYYAWETASAEKWLADFDKLHQNNY